MKTTINITKKLLTVLMGVMMSAAVTQAQTASVDKNLNLDIEGMTCTGCASGAANAVNQLDGVTAANVNFEQKTGAFAYDSSKVTQSQIIQAISKIGFKASVKQASVNATLDVSGMTCQMCANSVETALVKIDGVKDAKVSLTANQATVAYDSSKVTLDTLIATIGKAGGDRHSFKVEKTAQLACEVSSETSGKSGDCCPAAKIEIQ